MGINAEYMGVYSHSCLLLILKVEADTWFFLSINI